MRFRTLIVMLALAVIVPVRAQDEPRPTPTWQDAMARGLIPYHQLTVDDFPINDKAHPKHNFYVRTGIAPQYHFMIKPYNGFAYAHIDQWMVFAGLDKNQTSRKSTFKTMKAELPYAQAFLDINEIHARRIAALKPGELPNARGNSFEEAKTELTRKLKEFLDMKYKESEAEVAAFSKATKNGADKKKVRELTAKIRKRLKATPATTVPFPELPATPPPVGAVTPSAPAVPAAPSPTPIGASLPAASPSPSMSASSSAVASPSPAR